MAEVARAQAASSVAEPVVDGVDHGASAALAGRMRSLGDTPLVVITAARPGSRAIRGLLPPSLYRRAQAILAVMQNELAGLSSDHAHVVALRSDHFIQRADEQPQVVVRADPRVVTAVRDKATAPPASGCSAAPTCAA